MSDESPALPKIIENTSEKSVAFHEEMKELIKKYHGDAPFILSVLHPPDPDIPKIEQGKGVLSISLFAGPPDMSGDTYHDLLTSSIEAINQAGLEYFGEDWADYEALDFPDDEVVDAFFGEDA